MNEQKLERIKKKIAKIMALANNTSNENEARNAMRKAALLMANFHVSEGDIDRVDIVCIKKPMFKGRKNAMANEKKLFWAIAQSMGVYGVYWTATKPTYHYVGTPAIFELTGNACDIEVAWYLFEICCNQIKELAKVFRREHAGASQADANDYKMGLTIGLKNRFVQMAKTDLPEGKGLVPVDTRFNDAKEFYNEFNTKASSASLTVRANQNLSKGAMDSSKIHLNAGVSGAGQAKRLK